jgi:hypothetical protein
MRADPELTAFIRDQFRSVWSLELLLFLKDNPDSAWPNDRLVDALRARDAIVTKGLETLLAGGLIVVVDEGARYAPATKHLRELAEATQALYTRKPDAVRRLIISSVSTGLSAFADSFRLRRD